MINIRKLESELWESADLLRQGSKLTITIRDLLYQELPESYSDESISYYRDAVYDYVSRQYGAA